MLIMVYLHPMWHLIAAVSLSFRRLYTLFQFLHQSNAFKQLKGGWINWWNVWVELSWNIWQLAAICNTICFCWNHNGLKSLSRYCPALLLIAVPICNLQWNFSSLSCFGLLWVQCECESKFWNKTTSHHEARCSFANTITTLTYFYRDHTRKPKSIYATALPSFGLIYVFSSSFCVNEIVPLRWPSCILLGFSWVGNKKIKGTKAKL